MISAASTDRQLELTLNALARSVRKAIRLAETEDSAAARGAWEVVEHRAGLLQTMVKIRGTQFAGSLLSRSSVSSCR